MKRVFLVMCTLLAVVITQRPAFAATIVIDGVFTDWAGTVGQTDSNGPDDERSPRRADITEYRVDANTTNVYMVFTWDDISFTGGNATTTGMSIKGADGKTYRVFATASTNNLGQTVVELASLQVMACDTSTCKSMTTRCTGAACTGAAMDSSTTWIDPFAGRAAPDCDTLPLCATRDTAAEIQIPWSLVGGVPGSNQYAFFQYGSYPSGPGQGEKDVVLIAGGNGVSCYLFQGQLKCAQTPVTAITLKSLSAVWQNEGVGVTWITGTEQHTMGFHLLRSATQNRADAQVITSTLIPAEGNEVTGATYTHDDHTAASDGVYTYWLQEIEVDGTPNEYGPVLVRGPLAPPFYTLVVPMILR